MENGIDSRPIRVLLVEDDEDDYILCRELLAEAKGARFDLDWVESYGAALRRMEECEPDVCLIDYRFGEHTGLDLLREARRLGCRAPMILLTGQGDHRLDLEAMEAGAADYLVKGRIDAPLLERSIRYAIQRQRAEEALRESQERFRLLVEGAHDFAMFMLDPEGCIVGWNAGAERLTQYQESEVLGRSHGLFYLPEEIASDMPGGSLRTAATQGHCEVEGWRLRKDSSRYWASVVATALHSETGELRGFSMVVRDISDRLRLEEQLRQAQKMEAIGRLAGGVAHDFNNMLGAITGYADLLLHQVGPDEMVRTCLQEIMKASERSTALTRQLLAFSRQSVLSPRALDLNEVIEGMYPMLRRLISAEIELVTSPAPAACVAMVDPSQIEQVLLNLAINARDAMPDGGKLTIACHSGKREATGESLAAGAAPAEYVALSVSDTGTGMDEETRSRIFEPFFTTKEAGKGTGLGLATVHGIISQSGGRIEVESRPGAGTTFRIYLPRTDAPAATVEQGERPSAAEAAGAETILVVEDEPIVRQLVREVLQMQGYTVLEAMQGDEALRVCAEPDQAIDLLLTDMVMPGMSGRELALQAARMRPEMKVLLMSGYSQEGLRHEGESGREIDFIQKPFKPAALTHKVREVLRASS